MLISGKMFTNTISHSKNLLSSFTSKGKHKSVSHNSTFQNFPIICRCNGQYFYSKQKIIQDLQKFNEELQKKNSSLSYFQQQQKPSTNQFLLKQQKIIKDFLELTEESFSEHLETELKEKYHVDAEMLLMIIAGLEDPNIIRQNIVKIYPFIPILEKTELLLLFQLIVAHRPQTLPPLNTAPSRPLQNIEALLLILSEVYPKQERIVEWLKEVPLYKGKNVCMLAAGFFAVYEKMEQHVRFKNERLMSRCIQRISDLVVDEDDETQISTIILALQSPSTCRFAQKLLMDIQQIDVQQIDPLKLQLFFIHLQRHISAAYSETRKQVKTKNRYKILEESEEGEVVEKQEEEYEMKEGEKLDYAQLTQIERFKFLNHLSKTVLTKITDMNWNELLKLNILLDNWKLLESFPPTYPWNSFKNKLVNFTTEKQIIQKLVNLETDEVLNILEVMEKLKINKSQLLMKCLAMIAHKLGELNSQQLIKLAKVCVTFVRQCEDFLISVRFEIENRKFIFTDQQIDQLNAIFKRVLVLFPRPLIK